MEEIEREVSERFICGYFRLFYIKGGRNRVTGKFRDKNENMVYKMTISIGLYFRKDFFSPYIFLSSNLFHWVLAIVERLNGIKIVDKLE